MGGRKKPPTQAVTLRVGDKTQRLDLTMADFAALKQMAGGTVEVKTKTKDFERLRSLGLVTHRFSGDEWPKALAELTGLGRQALTQEFQPA
jgi:hypothetical protein